MAVTVTTLIENSLGEHKGLSIEHGLSFLVETDAGRLVFDTGQSANFIRNAETLNRSLKGIDTVVLSHGHYDHSGGLKDLLAYTGKKTDLWVGEGFFEPKYAKKGAGFVYIGNAFDRASIKSMGARVKTLSDPVKEIMPDVFLVTNFERTHQIETVNPRFILPDGNDWRVDTFDDEISVVVKTPKGLIFLVGCSHPGILNMISTVKSRFSEPLIAIMGGTHLVEADAPRLKVAVGDINQLPLEALGLSHCTGADAMAKFDGNHPGYFHNSTGTSLIVV
jgi:7,8-dihydropterin-6-yl-methyl-4-(beta-D-ribofuranosyl)aminobenzene 5'-phosphate synthase